MALFLQDRELDALAEAVRQRTNAGSKAEAVRLALTAQLGGADANLLATSKSDLAIIEMRRAALQAARSAGRRKATTGADAARSQDFLYDDHGQPV